MGDSILFVHGTGVRGEAYGRSFSQIKQRLHALDASVRLHSCCWGETEGVRLRANGCSIPAYDETGGREPSEEEEELALWAVLYTDPWYELRLLRYQTDGAGELPPGAMPPSQLLRDQIDEFEPSSELREDLRRLKLEEAFQSALDALRSAPEFDEAVETAKSDPLEHRRAIARAIVACALAAAVDDDVPVVDGATRDAVLECLTNELGGYGRGIADWLARPFKGVAARAVTRRVQQQRGAITDSSVPGAGDILRYQARGEGIRAYIRQAIEDVDSDHITLLAHSLGGIACVDLLILHTVPKVKRIITVGSQAPFLYEIGALCSLEYPAPLPSHFPVWLNIYDQRDFLSYVGKDVFPGRIVDVEVNNGQPFPQAHSAYWSNDAVWDAIIRFMA